MKIDDKELEKIFLKINKNKMQGIEELYSKYQKVVYGIAFTISKNKEDSEDIMQMIFAKIYEMESSKLPTSNYASWLYSTTKNETINFLKKKKNDIPIDKIYEISDDNNELNKVVDSIEFNKLISKLNDKEKEIISLKILSNKESDNNANQENIEQNTQIQEDVTNSAISNENTFQDKSENYNSETTQEESTKQDIDTTNTITNITQDINTTTQENTIYEEQTNSNHNPYIGYSFLGISIIFLLISLCFFIKYQLKHLKKLSK